MQHISERFQMMFQGLKSLFTGIPVEREMFPIDLSVGLRTWHHKVTERALAESKNVALVAPFNLLFSGKGQDFAAALAIFDEALRDETDYADLRQQVIAMHDKLTRIPYRTQERTWVEQMNQFVEELCDLPRWGAQRVTFLQLAECQRS